MAETRSMRSWIHQLKRRLILKAPARVPFAVDDHPFTIYGTYGGNCGLGHDFARNGCHEPILSRMLLQACMQNPSETVFWDVGSGFGYFCVIAAKTARPEGVHAFEPGPAYGFLEYNNRRLGAGRWHTYQAFAGAAPDSASMTVDLDDYAGRNGDPTIVKIDVDGAEISVLESAANTLQRAQPILFLEVHFKGSQDYSEIREQLLETLSDLPYQYHFCRNHRRLDAPIEPIESLSALPREQDASFDDDDYLLIARPPPGRPKSPQSR